MKRIIIIIILIIALSSCDDLVINKNEAIYPVTPTPIKKSLIN